VAAPGAKILCVGERFEPQITYSRNVVTAERTAGRLDVFYANFTNTGSYVCDHPHISEHRRIAGQLVRAIVPMTSWTTGPTAVAAPSATALTPYASPAARLLMQTTGALFLVDGTSLDLRGRILTDRDNAAGPTRTHLPR
jgi:hypothetical protein